MIKKDKKKFDKLSKVSLFSLFSLSFKKKISPTKIFPERSAGPLGST